MHMPRSFRPALSLFAVALAPFTASAIPQVEHLGRGLAAVVKDDGGVFLTWRLLADDPADIAFNVYRTTTLPEGKTNTDFGQYRSVPDVPAGTVKLNTTPVADVTWILDAKPALQNNTTYLVRALIKGVEQPESRPVVLAAGSAPRPCFSVPMINPPGYEPLEGSAADLDGDGEYELIVMQAGRHQDNSKSGVTDEPILQAYKLDGSLLWEIHLGKNIRGGSHYTQFIVYDFDGDGRAELACKTADGTIDATGKVIGDASANYVNAGGHVLAGPEFLTVFDGLTGAALDTVPYEPARHPTNPLHPTTEELKSVWGDGRGNRSDRFLAGVAYLDGTHPSLIMARGYYTRTCLAAWDFKGGKLVKRWFFDSDDGTEGNRAFRGQGNHQLSIADVDDDGRDEIVYGAMVFDDEGTVLHATGWGHGDALHVSDFNYNNPGIEIFDIQERFDKQGLSLRDGKTGRPLVLVPSVKADDEGGDKGEGPGRGIAINIDPRTPGAELWGIGAGITDMFDSEGKFLRKRPADLPANFAVWWDGDLLRELLDQNFVAKWNWETETVDRLLTAHECISSNGTKATPFLSADLWGDWREEIIWRTRDGSALHIYTSTIPTKYRMVTLMQDPQYRCAIAWQNVAYNQPPHPSFALDPGLPLPKRRAVQVLPASGR
jgi:rhamnogalacturonan endolyase